MFLDKSIYQIDHNDDNRLLVRLSKQALIQETVLSVVTSLLVVFFFAGQIDLQNIELAGVGLALFLLFNIYLIIQNIRLIKQGEVWGFNQLSNSISLNTKLVGRLDDLVEIKLIEYADHDDLEEYELFLKLKNAAPIRFRKSTDLDQQRRIGKAIAHLSDTQFNFKSRDEIMELEQALYDEKMHAEQVKLFEVKFENKSPIELKEIAQKDGPFATYAKEAAQNLLDQQGR